GADRAMCNSAVGIDHDQDVGRGGAQVLNAEIQSVALAPSGQVVALNDLGTIFCGHRGRVIAAIVGDHKQSVARVELLTDVGECGYQSSALVMRWYQNCYPSIGTVIPWGLWPAIARSRPQACNDLGRKYCHQHCQYCDNEAQSQRDKD